MDPRLTRSNATDCMNDIVTSRPLRAMGMEGRRFERRFAFNSSTAPEIADPIDVRLMEGPQVRSTPLGVHQARHTCRHTRNAPVSGWEAYFRAYGPETFWQHRLRGKRSIFPELLDQANLPSMEEFHLLSMTSVLPYETNTPDAPDEVTAHGEVDNLGDDPDQTGLGLNASAENAEEEGVIHYDWHTLWPLESPESESIRDQEPHVPQSSPPFPEILFNALDARPIALSKIPDDDAGADKCVLCWEPYSDADPPLLVHGSDHSHVIGSKCLREWFAALLTTENGGGLSCTTTFDCPQCQRSLETPHIRELVDFFYATQRADPS